MSNGNSSGDGGPGTFYAEALRELRKHWQRGRKVHNVSGLRDAFSGVFKVIEGNVGDKCKPDGPFGQIMLLDERRRRKDGHETGDCVRTGNDAALTDGWQANEARVSFCLTTGPEGTIAKRLATELGVLRGVYSFKRENLLRQATEKGGIWFAVRQRKDTPLSPSTGRAIPPTEYSAVRVEEYLSWKPEEMLNFVEGRRTGEKRDKAILEIDHIPQRGMFDQLLVASEELIDVGMAKGFCTVCAIFDLGFGIESSTGLTDESEGGLGALNKRVEAASRFHMLVSTAASALTSFVFSEASTKPLEKLRAESLIESAEDFRLQWKKSDAESKESRDDALKRLFKEIWMIEDGFTKRAILRSLWESEDTAIRAKINKSLDWNGENRNDYVGRIEHVTAFRGLDAQHASKLISDTIAACASATPPRTPYSILADLAFTINQKGVTLDVLEAFEKHLPESQPDPEYSGLELWQAALALHLLHADSPEIQQKCEGVMATALSTFGGSTDCADIARRLTVSANLVSSVIHEATQAGLREEKSPNHLPPFNNPEERHNLKLLPRPCRSGRGEATRVTAVFSQKGGVGKTTAALNIGMALAEMLPQSDKRPCCLLELDFGGPTLVHSARGERRASVQGESNRLLDFRLNSRDLPEEINGMLTSEDVARGGTAGETWARKLEILPARSELLQLLRKRHADDVYSARQLTRRLKKILQALHELFDHVIIDTAAEFRLLTDAAAGLAKTHAVAAVLVATPAVQTFSTLGDTARAFVAHGGKTSFLFNQVFQLESRAFQNPTAFVDHLSTLNPSNWAAAFPYSRSTALLHQLHRHEDAPVFMIPWLPELHGTCSVDHGSCEKLAFWKEIAEWICSVENTEE